ncbi:hypothetical protein [Lihuaxuella thermophila]|uniref:Uncharacterized protein n=1 Tax=Lihuaxuella thermophila TaxID=1173111 RepID=A0A1H8HG94_9BACL|nr:hypothetical protein [Lihuaxuella thermophila]SEN55176.1 hypothetical protein SAMN05444955_11418 [Lihuaxuella thermophila]
MKDPRQIVDAFRTDVRSRNIYNDLLRQFDLERPNRRRNRRKFRPLGNQGLSNTAIMSLCLVTGLAAGVGTASADDEFIPEQAPFDQPPSKVKIDEEKPAPNERKVERNLTRSPHRELEKKEPVRVPKSKDVPPAERADRTGELASGHSGGKAEKPPSRKEETKQPAGEIKQEVKKERQQAAEHKAESRVPQRSSQRDVQPEHSSVNENVKEAFKEVRKGTRTGKRAGEDISEPSKNAGSQGLKQAPDSNPAHLAVSGAADKSQSVSHAQGTAIPKTEQGGKLPQTAGNDLNGVIVGSGAALLGALYALRRGKEKKS